MKNSAYYIILGFVLTLALGSCIEDGPVIMSKSDLADYIEGTMDSQNIPALSLIIFDEEDKLYEKQFGQANIDQDITLRNDDLFLLASISKVVTATALLQLLDQDLFDLDDYINDYLPFSVSVPDQTTPITFRMLLTHTSGIADGSALDDQYYYGEDSPIELSYFLENYLVPGGDFYNAEENFHNFEPGTVHEYSNEGSALIAVLVEVISNQDFNSYCKENIFEPLDMDDTFWRLDEAEDSNGTLVQPYNSVSGGYEEIDHYTFTDYPNGGLRSTGRDMMTFMRAFMLDGRVDDYQLLEASTIGSMFTPQIIDIDEEVGFHMFVMDDELNLWGHDGGEQGVATIMAFNPSTNIGAIVLANQGEVSLQEILQVSYEFGVNSQ